MLNHICRVDFNNDLNHHQLLRRFASPAIQSSPPPPSSSPPTIHPLIDADTAQQTPQQISSLPCNELSPRHRGRWSQTQRRSQNAIGPFKDRPYKLDPQNES